VRGLNGKQLNAFVLIRIDLLPREVLLPIFEYRCESCRKVYEALILKSSGEKDLRCPYCRGRKRKRLISGVSVVRSASQKQKDRMQALSKVDPTKPQEVARHFKEHGSRFEETGFRGKKPWQDAVDRVAAGGPTLEE
jgi:putative FmdB family regulatory protein